DEPFVADRLVRIGARAPLKGAGATLVSPLVHAIRMLDTGEAPSAEPLLATGARDTATLRMAERLARRAGSAPQLANALALAAEAHQSRIMAARALEGLASLVAWTLPPSEDYEPWERLFALGSSDVAGIDTLVGRAHRGVVAKDPAAIQATTGALMRRAERAT